MQKTNQLEKTTGLCSHQTIPKPDVMLCFFFREIRGNLFVSNYCVFTSVCRKKKSSAHVQQTKQVKIWNLTRTCWLHNFWEKSHPIHISKQKQIQTQPQQPWNLLTRSFLNRYHQWSRKYASLSKSKSMPARVYTGGFIIPMTQYMAS